MGKRGERDRKLTVVDAARYAIVGQRAQIVVRIDDLGGGNGGSARRRPAHRRQRRGRARAFPSAATRPISVPITHEGESVVEIEAAARALPN